VTGNVSFPGSTSLNPTGTVNYTSAVGIPSHPRTNIPPPVTTLLVCRNSLLFHGYMWQFRIKHPPNLHLILQVPPTRPKSTSKNGISNTRALDHSALTHATRRRHRTPPPGGTEVVGTGIDAIRTDRIVSLVVRRSSAKPERVRPTDRTQIRCVYLY
jgi:hypothetical protein